MSTAETNPMSMLLTRSLRRRAGTVARGLSRTAELIGPARETTRAWLTALGARAASRARPARRGSAWRHADADVVHALESLRRASDDRAGAPTGDR